MTRKIDISHKTIFFMAGFLALVWILFNIRDLILLTFIAFIIVSAISPAVDKLISWRFPKALAITLMYLLILLSLVAIITLGVTPITTQTSDLIARLSVAFNNISGVYHFNTSTIQTQLPSLEQNILSFTIDVFKGFITLVLVVVISIYLMSDKTRVEDSFAKLFGPRRDRVQKLVHRIETKLGAWLRGQLFLSLIIGVLIYIGLIILGLDFALPLAILAGLFEIIPFFGPILSAIPAILIALITSPVLALIVAAIYIIVQQIESHVLVPQVMKKAVGLNPLVVILAIAIGDRLLGVTGALLAVPIAVVCQVIGDDYFNGRELE